MKEADSTRRRDPGGLYACDPSLRTTVPQRPHINKNRTRVRRPFSLETASHVPRWSHTAHAPTRRGTASLA